MVCERCCDRFYAFLGGLEIAANVNSVQAGCTGGCVVGVYSPCCVRFINIRKAKAVYQIR